MKTNPLVGQVYSKQIKSKPYRLKPTPFTSFTERCLKGYRL